MFSSIAKTSSGILRETAQCRTMIQPQGSDEISSQEQEIPLINESKVIPSSSNEPGCFNASLAQTLR
jgi:hypothetical protein